MLPMLLLTFIDKKVADSHTSNSYYNRSNINYLCWCGRACHQIQSYQILNSWPHVDVVCKRTNKIIYTGLVKMKVHSSKRNSESRKASAVKLPLINQQKSLPSSSKKRIPDMDFLLELKRDSSQARSSNEQIRTNSKHQPNHKQITPIVIPVKERKPSRQKLPSHRLRTQSKSNVIKHSSLIDNRKSYDENDQETDKTLESFQRYVKKNKQHIHTEITQRRKLIDEDHRGSYFIKSSNTKHSAPLQPRHQGKLSQNDSGRTKIAAKKARRNITSADEDDSAVFAEIQKIINNKISESEAKSLNRVELNHAQHSVKLAKLIRNIRKLSPDKSISEIRQGFQLEKSLIQNSPSSDKSSSRVILKDENNYHEWRRVDFLSDSSDCPNYKKSTFEMQNERLEKFILKNEVSLSKYLDSRKQLLKYKPNTVKTSIS